MLAPRQRICNYMQLYLWQDGTVWTGRHLRFVSTDNHMVAWNMVNGILLP